MSNRGAHWKGKTPGAIQQYINQDATEDEVIIRHVAGPDGMLSVRLPKRCHDCDTTRPRCGFAPAFNLNLEWAGGRGWEILILLCNDCYDRRCAKEAMLDRKVG